jgi:mRNA-degrading endonuclease toxin of MazEF toxin-antitoxin module
MQHMTTYKFGDVILVSFPFTDQSTSKKRPAIVISSDIYNEHVKCGLTFKCGQKHKKNAPVLVRIKAGQTIANIKPHDWYTRN